MKKERSTKHEAKRMDPVVPRMWHGPATNVPEEVLKHGIDPRAYGIDTRHALKFETFSNEVDRWADGA